MIHGLRVLDRSTGIAGPYCAKLLADAGADVVKVEPAGGDPMRSWRSGGLFEFLHQSKRSVQGDDHVLCAGADMVVTNHPEEAAPLRAAHPEMIVVSISPFGADGPWAGRPATELTLQAACGSMGSRGEPELPPLPAGGRIGEWLTGTYAAVAALGAVGLTGSGPGRHVDVAMLDCMATSLVTYPSLFASLLGWPAIQGTGRTVEVPSIEPTEDGYAVFTTNSAQQFQDFVVMIGRPDWLDDPGLARAPERFSRRKEFLGPVREWTSARTTAAALEEAGTFRIPAGPVLNGATVVDFEQFVARGVYERSPSGRFRQPRTPYRITDTVTPARRPAPDLGADTGSIEWMPRSDQRGRAQPPAAAGPAASRDLSRLPLAGIRILDCTAWWAGPAATHVLASLGADVVKIESIRRPDLMRMSSARTPDRDQWWEWGGVFHGVNVNKRGVTVDLSRPEGIELFERLARHADAVVENYTPRVMEQFGLEWDHLHALNPSLVMVRMPAFGLDGPWRDRTGFAQTMESISGLAWLTGYEGSGPVLPRGSCDPLAGLHAAWATMLALRARAADGKGRMVEATMVEAALNAAVEQVIEWDASGALVDRRGSRGGVGAPQGVYRCEGDDRWVALAVASQDQWNALLGLGLMGADPDPSWETHASRLERADEIDALITAWCRGRPVDEVVDQLISVGVPAAVVVAGRDIVSNPQLRHRGLFETEDHPVTGAHETPTMPFRYEGVEGWLRLPSPTLGQHNSEILGEVAAPEELALWAEQGIIGDRLAGR